MVDEDIRIQREHISKDAIFERDAEFSDIFATIKKGLIGTNYRKVFLRANHAINKYDVLFERTVTEVEKSREKTDKTLADYKRDDRTFVDNDLMNAVMEGWETAFLGLREALKIITLYRELAKASFTTIERGYSVGWRKQLEDEEKAEFGRMMEVIAGYAAHHNLSMADMVKKAQENLEKEKEKTAVSVAELKAGKGKEKKAGLKVRVIYAIKRFYKEHKRWPTTVEICKNVEGDNNRIVGVLPELTSEGTLARAVGVHKEKRYMVVEGG